MPGATVRPLSLRRVLAVVVGIIITIAAPFRGAEKLISISAVTQSQAV